MHTNKHYGPDSPAARVAAIADIRDYLTPAKFDAINAEMSEIPFTKFCFVCTFLAGIEGYPVIAWYESYHGEGSYAKGLLEAQAKERESMKQPGSKILPIWNTPETLAAYGMRDPALPVISGQNAMLDDDDLDPRSSYRNEPDTSDVPSTV